MAVDIKITVVLEDTANEIVVTRRGRVPEQWRESGAGGGGYHPPDHKTIREKVAKVAEEAVVSALRGL